VKSWLKPLLLIAGICFTCAGVSQIAADVGWLGGIGTGRIRVAIFEETENRSGLSNGQLAVLTSHSPDSVWAFCQSHCEKDDKGIAFRELDKGADVSLDLPWVQSAKLVAVGPYPFLVVLNSSGRFLYGSHIQGESESLSVLRRYGGP
jgi:hypothetical protein